jgi:hypothetical protein
MGGYVDPLLANYERAAKATAFSVGAAGRPLCAAESRAPSGRIADSPPSADPDSRRRSVRIGEPFQPAGNLDARLRLRLARHTIVEAALDHQVMQFEEESTNKILHLRLCRGL